MAYRLPSGEEVKSAEVYAEAWEAMGKKLEQVFDGYVFSSCNPGFTLEKRLVDENNKYRVTDRFTITVDAANLLLRKLNMA